jgi:hypothetical protein
VIPDAEGEPDENYDPTSQDEPADADGEPDEQPPGESAE